MALGAAGVFFTMVWATIARLRRLRPNVETTFALKFAGMEAIRRRHSTMTIDHLAFALLFDPRVAQTLRAVGADPAAIRAKIDAHLGPDADPASPIVEPGSDDDIIVVLRSAYARRRSAPPELVLYFITLGPGSLARSLLPEMEALSRAPSPRRSVLVDCDRRSSSAYRGGGAFSGDTQIRLFDDDVTPAAHVTATLTTTFDLSEKCARYVVQRIGDLESAAVGPWPREEAERLATKARDDARAAGFPLRFEIGPAA